ncbi:MAG: RloB family protein [Ruminococcus sp.]
MGEGEWLKEKGKRRITGRRNVGRNIWKRKNFATIFSAKDKTTEPNYFQGFKRYIEDNPIYRDMVLIEIEGCQAETMRVIGKAEEYVRENKITKGQIWCVYDKDSFPSCDVNGSGPAGKYVEPKESRTSVSCSME